MAGVIRKYENKDLEDAVKMKWQQCRIVCYNLRLSPAIGKCIYRIGVISDIIVT
ncbi:MULTISPECIES: hypothetical protein [unclassified Butyrivibrio]|uniref:hypothetical protein n=1 Tax=unclassified Butyrivibrio TaxID=2639466 RepID=UPI00041CED2D|nr:MULTISPECIES: hypothetical protein [unclassified Butyrivibrio]